MLPKSHKPDIRQSVWKKRKKSGIRQWDGNRKHDKRAGRLTTENKSKIGKIPYLEHFSHNVSVCNAFVLTCGKGQDRMRTNYSRGSDTTCCWGWLCWDTFIPSLCLSEFLNTVFQMSSNPVECSRIQVVYQMPGLHHWKVCFRRTKSGWCICVFLWFPTDDAQPGLRPDLRCQTCLVLSLCIPSVTSSGITRPLYSKEAKLPISAL